MLSSHAPSHNNRERAVPASNLGGHTFLYTTASTAHPSTPTSPLHLHPPPGQRQKNVFIVKKNIGLETLSVPSSIFCALGCIGSWSASVKEIYVGSGPEPRRVHIGQRCPATGRLYCGNLPRLLGGGGRETLGWTMGETLGWIMGVLGLGDYGVDNGGDRTGRDSGWTTGVLGLGET